MNNKQLLHLNVFVIGIFLMSSCGVSRHATGTDFYGVYSQKLGIQLEGKENKELIKTVAEWKGVPYKYGGKSKSGTDCSGFVSSVYSEVFGKSLHRSSDDMVEDVRFVSKRNLETGDILFFKINSRKITHVAIYIADNKFIHATTKKGVMVNDLDDSYYKQYFYKAGRVRM